MPPRIGDRPMTATERSRTTRDRQRAYVAALERAVVDAQTTPTRVWMARHAETLARAREARMNEGE